MTQVTRNEKDRVVIFDTTLRDGEQSPRATMSLAEKLQVARALEKLGVDVIEAGFPIASDGDFRAVRTIAMRSKRAVIAGLATAKPEAIIRCGEAIAPATKKGRGRIHTFISTSPVHMKWKLQLSPERVFELVTESVRRSRCHTDNVEWSAEDATRTEFDFLCRCVEAAICAGATTINLPDTVGYMVDSEYGDLFRKVMGAVPNADKARFSVHCHNDLGEAKANSLRGVQAGARQIECTINGIGERAGNAALEEVVATLMVRADVFMPLWCGVDATKLGPTSKLVSRVTGFAVPRNKAIVGRNAFAHESGIHQDGMLKHTQTYEIMTPESVGVRKSTLVLGKHSGRHGVEHLLRELGFVLGKQELDSVYKALMSLADRKKHLFDDDVIAVIETIVGKSAATQNRIKLISLEVPAGTMKRHKAKVVLDVACRRKSVTATSVDGPIDAALRAVKKAVPHRARLVEYHVDKLAGGTNASAEVFVELSRNGRTASTSAEHRDTVVASVKVYIAALNRLRIKPARSKLERVSGI